MTDLSGVGRKFGIKINIVPGSEVVKCQLRLRTCIYCGTFRTRLAGVLKMHVNEKHRYRCKACHRAFPDKRAERLHRLWWHQNEQHHCVQCCKTFASHKAYRSHGKCQQHSLVLRARADVFNQVISILGKSSTDGKYMLVTVIRCQTYD
ncbi:zinc finger protein 57-like [Gigantopelta aegis]|uniref:zinc finger protein 57-like n=1 Tax=Gigantopelta aegis TaxID=1735272 RepID=UPI001B88A1C6|nr:zinc finger protein 57-like [Gigantopelta aegis]